MTTLRAVMFFFVIILSYNLVLEVCYNCYINQVIPHHIQKMFSNSYFPLIAQNQLTHMAIQCCQISKINIKNCIKY